MNPSRLFLPVITLTLVGLPVVAVPTQPHPPVQSNVKVPVRIALSGPAAPMAGQTIEVTLDIERLALQNLDLTWVATLPDGVVAADEVTRETLHGATPAKLTRKLHLRLQKLPTTDLTVTAELAGKGIGLKAVATYAFGRTAATTNLPKPAPSPGKVNGRTLSGSGGSAGKR